MKKFNQFVKEDLNGALVEPQSAASAEASRLGLVYVGFGRYENPQTQQITHIVVNGKLVPYTKAIKTNSFKQTSGADLSTYVNDMSADLQPLQDVLLKHYSDIGYTGDELAAVQQYTQGSDFAINNRLWQLPVGIPADQIQPAYDGDTIPQTVASLDNALMKSQTPTDLLTYIALPKDFDITSINQGSNITFKGYRSSTLNPSLAVEGAGAAQELGNFDLRRKTFMLQLKVPKGSSGMYVDDYSANPGESEFLLPRGSTVTISSTPKKLVAGNANISRDDEIYFFEANLVSN